MNVKDGLIRANVECNNGDAFRPVNVIRISSSRLGYWTISFDSHLPHCWRRTSFVLMLSTCSERIVDEDSY